MDKTVKCVGSQVIDSRAVYNHDYQFQHYCGDFHYALFDYLNRLMLMKRPCPTVSQVMVLIAVAVTPTIAAVLTPAVHVANAIQSV